MVPAVVTTVVAFLAAFLVTLGDVQRPTQGHQMGSLPDLDIVIPLSITQCEPVLIYYNISTSFHDQAFVILDTPDQYYLLFLYLPIGVGYLDWICNIPTGYSFLALGYGPVQNYTVQPGSSSACLGGVTTTYSYASYDVVNFQSYTIHSPISFFSSPSHLPATVAFPTNSFPTVTVNPNFAAASTTITFAVSSTLSSPPTSPVVSSSASPYKLHKAVIAGSVVGGTAFVMLTLITIFMFLRKRRNSSSNETPQSLTPYPGLMTSQLEQTHFSAPLLPSSDAIDAAPRGSEFNISQMAVPDTRWRNDVPSIKSRNRGADLASTFDVTRLTASQRQALITSLNASASTTTPETSPPARPPVDATQMPAALLSTSETVQEDLPDIVTILDVISRAQLNPIERRTLVASLSNLLMLDQSTPANQTRGNTTSLPPPYME